MSAAISANDLFKRQIRDWIAMDNEQRVLKRELEQRKKAKEQLTKQLMESMKHRSIDVLNTNDGELHYHRRAVKKPVTQKMLLKILSSYFDGNTAEATKINNYILESREEVVQETIVRK
jgi:DNA-nicking Smr family endonuclease